MRKNKHRRIRRRDVISTNVLPNPQKRLAKFRLYRRAHIAEMLKAMLLRLRAD